MDSVRYEEDGPDAGPFRRIARIARRLVRRAVTRWLAQRPPERRGCRMCRTARAAIAHRAGAHSGSDGSPDDSMAAPATVVQSDIPELRPFLRGWPPRLSSWTSVDRQDERAATAWQSYWNTIDPSRGVPAALYAFFRPRPIYTPPVVRRWECQECWRSWVGTIAGDCPRCGSAYVRRRRD